MSVSENTDFIQESPDGKMKFAERLEALEKHYPVGWDGTLLHYNSLNEKLQHCRKNGCVVTEEQFFQELLNEVDRISQLFEGIAKAVLNAHKSSPGCLNCFVWKRKIRLANGMTMEVTPDSLAECARLCINYAKANALALRKIIEKHDRYCQTDEGMCLLREFWSGTSGRASFLHSPLLMELAAVEMGLYDTGEVIPADVCVIGKGECPPESHCTMEECCFSDEDLHCAICLDTLYKPIALGCGHMFCQDCLFKASGEGGALGTVRAILSNISHNAKCPKCRQRAVFKNAVILTQTAAMLQMRHPEYWQQREREEIETTKKMREAYVKRRKEELRSVGYFHPSLLLYS